MPKHKAITAPHAEAEIAIARAIVEDPYGPEAFARAVLSSEADWQFYVYAWQPICLLTQETPNCDYCHHRHSPTQDHYLG